MSSLSPQQDCQVCLTISKAIRTGTRRSLGLLSEVTAMPCPHAPFIQTLCDDKERYNDLGHFSIGISTEEASYPAFFLRDRLSGFIRCFIYCYNMNEKEEADPKQLILNPVWIGLPLVRTWYETCLKEHGAQCQEPLRVQVDSGVTKLPDWLIDTEEQCIVPVSLDTEPIYFTLSYVWGKVDCLKTNTNNLDGLRQQGSLHPDKANNIPWTVRDAMKPTQLLGERYLWVDSLCIVQDDETTFQKNLDAMHLIYANSALCLVAEAGHDANYGLRGIEGASSPRCARQITLDVPEYTLLYSLRPEKSTYNQRVWTYQEFAFAKRRFVFHPSGRTRWSSSSCDIAEEEKSPAGGVSMRFRHMSWLEKREPVMSVLGDVARGFGDRHSTYPGDVMRSFLGTKSHLQRIFLGPMNYGHPETFFDVSLAWSHSSDWLTRRGADDSPEDGYLPSWSWMGWKGNIDFLADDEFEIDDKGSGVTEPVAEWYAMDSPLPPILAPTSRRIESTWHHWKKAFQADTSAIPYGWERRGTSYILSGDDMPSRAHRSQFGYPIPVPTAAESLRSVKELPFLFARTTRAYFAARQVEDYDEVELWSSDGRFGGYVQPLTESHHDEFLASDQIELVAIVKGWLSMALVEGNPAPVDSNTDDASERTNCDGYFVLCITREDNGVSKRRGSGFVLANVWDEIKEPVDLILG